MTKLEEIAREAERHGLTALVDHAAQCVYVFTPHNDDAMETDEPDDVCTVRTFGDLQTVLHY